MAISRVQEILQLHPEVKKAVSLALATVDQGNYHSEEDKYGIHTYAHWRYTQAYTYPSILVVAGWTRTQLNHYAFWLELYINQYLRANAPELAPLIGHPYLGALRHWQPLSQRRPDIAC